MRWDEGSLRGTTRLKTLTRSSEKLGCADLFRRGCAVRLLRRRLAGRRSAFGMFAPKGANSPPAQQSRAIRLQLGGPAGPPNLPGRGRSERENAFSPLFAPDIGGGPSGIGRGSAETGGAPGSVTALAAGEAALLARDRGARGSRAFPARGRERGYFTTDGRGLQRGNEAARGLPAASKKLRVFSKKRLTK